MARTATASKKAETYKGVVLDKVDPVRLTEYLAEFGIEVEVEKGQDERIALLDALEAHTQAVKEANKLKSKDERTAILQCPTDEDGCGAYQPADKFTASACPVCGLSDTEEEDGEEGEKSISEEVEVVEAVGEVVTKVTKRPNVVSDETQIQVLGTVEDLDLAVKKVKAFVQETVTGTWELGLELSQIFDKGLYKLRTTDAGLPMYNDFNEFVTAEIGISKRYADNLRIFAIAFSKEDFTRIGPAKITLIHHAQLPAAEREALLEKARAGTSLKALKREAEKLLPPERKSSKNGAGVRTSKSSGGAGTVMADPEAAGGRDNRITCTFQKGTLELKMEPKGKKKVAHQDLLNGASIEYTYDPKTDILVIHVSRE